jgi:hypothetical protein
VLNNGDRLMDIRLNFDFVTLKFRRCLRKGFGKCVWWEGLRCDDVEILRKTEEEVRWKSSQIMKNRREVGRN